MRQRYVAGFIAVLLGVAATRGARATSQKERYARFDAKIAGELAARSPEGAALFAQANQARERGDHRLARDLYARVHRMVPSFSHALRREAGEELVLDHHDRAIALDREALTLEPSAANLAALSLALASSSGGLRPSDLDRQEALGLARRATQLEPDYLYAHVALAQAALAANDFPLLGETADRAVAIAPEEPVGYAFQSLARASRGELDAAETSLEAARARGFPDGEYRRLRSALRAARPWYVRWGGPALAFLLAWVAGLLLLLYCGWFLSRATLGAAQRAPGQASGEVTGSSLRLRRVYRSVLWLSCLYYWLSVPVVALLVLAAAGLALYGVFALGHVPIKLVVLIVVLLFATLRAMARGLVARGRDDDPGQRLEPDEEPRLRDLLHDVAGKIGTRAVDNVYLTPGVDLAVMERGGMLKQLRGASERCLILGIGVLDGLAIGPFKAILAHEYGHFSNHDTAGGGFALGVRRSLLTMARHLAESGAARWYNPAWLFVSGFYRVFLRISQGASRLQEFLADRWAAFTYGSAAFERGLRHVVERSIRFNAHAEAALNQVVRTKLPVANLYVYRSDAEPDARQLDEQVEKAIHRDPSAYDSHPAPASRILWVHALAARGLATSREDEDEAWSLFRSREAFEKRLTVAVMESLRARHGIAVVESEPEPTPASP